MFNDSSPYVRIVNPAHLFCVTVLDGRNGLTQLCLKWNIDRLLMLRRRAVTTCIIDARINCYLKQTWNCQKCVHSSKHTNIEPVINCEVAVCSWFWFKQSLHASLHVTHRFFMQWKEDPNWNTFTDIMIRNTTVYILIRDTRCMCGCSAAQKAVFCTVLWVTLSFSPLFVETGKEWEWDCGRWSAVAPQKGEGERKTKFNLVTL